MKRKMCCLWLLLALFAGNYAYAFKFDVPSNITWVRQINTLLPGQQNIVYNTLQINALPGDTLFLIGGSRAPIRIDDLKGDSLTPIVLCNKNTKVTITQPVGGYYGMAFNACRYIKVSGKKNPAIAYGIFITQLPLGSALSINNFSSNFEVEGVEISRVYSSGIVAKTDPTCSNVLSYSSFVMYDLKFHHNYIHHTGNEGFYIGNTGYAEGAGNKLTCTSPAFIGAVLPHKIIGVKVYENMLDSNGWDAIQVASSTQVEIFDNYITNDSYADVANQQSGIMIGQPAQAKVYRNYIVNGKGHGIQCFGVGVSIYNNVIVNPGNSALAKGYYNIFGQLVNANFTYGIYINDKVCKDPSVPKLPYLVANNTIVIQKIFPLGSPYNTWAPQGINGNSMAYINGSHFVNNLIVIDSNIAAVVNNPVNGIFASNAVPNYSTANAPSFISCNARTTLGNNFYSNEIQSVLFGNWQDKNFSLQSLSNAVDAGVGSVVYANTALQTDILKATRPQGSMPDFGAYESASLLSTNYAKTVSIVPNPISQAQWNTLPFNLYLNDTNYSANTEVYMVGAFQQVQLPIVLDQVMNGKIILTVQGNTLPVQAGVYSVQVKSNGVLKAYANLLIVP